MDSNQQQEMMEDWELVIADFNKRHNTRVNFEAVFSDTVIDTMNTMFPYEKVAEILGRTRVKVVFQKNVL